MKKGLMNGMAVLFASTAFVACSHDSFFDENAADTHLKKEYRSSFEEKYGRIDANQTWDFTEPLVYDNTAMTRIVPNENRQPQATYTTESGIVVKQYSLSSVLGEYVIDGHKSKIQKKLQGKDGGYTEKHWDNDVNVFTIWACFVTPASGTQSNLRMKIGVHRLSRMYHRVQHNRLTMLTMHQKRYPISSRDFQRCLRP